MKRKGGGGDCSHYDLMLPHRLSATRDPGGSRQLPMRHEDC